jgi:hypothetical protein
MEEFIHKQNIARYRHLLAGKLDESSRQTLLKLLADETAKDHRALDHRCSDE